MRLWSILLLALLLPCFLAQEQVPSEEAVESPRSFPRSRLRPRLHRPTSTAPLTEEVVEEIVVEEEQVTTAAAPTAKPRSRGKGRAGKTTPPPTVKEENGAGDESTTVAASTRRPGGKTRNRNRNRNRSKTTSTSPIPTDGTTTKGSKRRGSGRRTTTKATTEALATTSARPSRSRSRGGSRNRNRSTTPKSATTLHVEEQTQRKGGRSRSKNQNSKSPRRSTTRKPTTTITTTAATTRTTTTTLRTTPLEQEELRNIPPIPLQRNPELLAPPPVKPEDRNMNPEMEKNMKTLAEDEMLNDKAMPPLTSRIDGPQLTIKDPSLVNANKPLRPLPVEGLILEEPLEISDDAKPGKPPRIENRAQLGIPLEGSVGKDAFETPLSRQEFEGVPPKLIGPVESKDLLLSKAIKENFDDPKSPLRPALPKFNEDEEGKIEQDDPRSKLPIQNESLERKGLLSERNEGVPPKPIELVSIRPPKKTEELPVKSKANIADEALPVNSGRFGNDGSRLPERLPANEREEERGVWSFDATIRPNLISSPSPIRSGSRRTTFEDLPTTPRSKSASKETLSVKDSSSSRGSGAGRVTPFPVRFESVRSDEIKEENDRSKQNTVSSRIPANLHGGFPNPFEEDDEIVPQFHRSTSSLKLKSRTTEPSVQLENSRNRLRSISSKDTDRLRANQLNVGRTEDIPSTTTTRSRTTFSREIPVTNIDDIEITTKRPFRERTDVITPEGAPPQLPPNPEAGGEGFIPLHTKLSFEDDIEEEPINTPKPPFVVPPRSHLLAIENSSKAPEATKPKSGSRFSLDDDPFVVPPAEIGKFASKKAEESEAPPKEVAPKEVSPKPQKATTASWSKPVMDDFTTKRFKPATEKSIVTLPEKGFSPRIPTDDGSSVQKSTLSDLPRNVQSHPSVSDIETPPKPLPPAVPARERPSRFEAEAIPTHTRKLDAPQTDDKVPSSRGRETVNQFESPTFVIRKPYASPPPRGAKTTARPVVDYEAADSIPSRQSTQNRAKIPTEGRERTHVDNRDRAPVENRKQTHVDRMPVDDMGKMPVEKMDKMPVEKMDKMPAEKMDQMPAEKMDKMPAEKMDKMPVDDMDKMPKTSSKSEHVPAKSRDDQIVDQRTQDEAVIPEAPATRPPLPPPPPKIATTAAPDDYDDDYYDDEEE